jgi:hypothetical protein
VTTSNDGQYGGWCTNWAAYDVPTLWEMLQNEDPLQTTRHVSAWRMTHELLSYHRAELQRCRDDLAAKWSAANSPAAGAFLNYVDNMLASMKSTSDAAVSTYEGLSGINGALITAKAKVGKLHEQWQKYQHEEDTSFSIFGLRPFADTPDDWKAQLTAQAAKEMYKADTEVFESTAKLTPPDVYKPTAEDTYGGGSKDLVADGTATGTGASHVHNGRAGGSDWAQPPFIPAPAPVPPPSPAQDVVLTGVAAAPVAPPPTVTPTPPSPNPPPSLPAPIVPPGRVIGPRPGLPGESPLSSGRGPVSSIRTGRAGTRPAGVVPEGAGVRGRSPLAPGGVIGGEPLMSRPAESAMSRVNPVGGVIGERPAGRAVASGGQPVGVVGRRGAGRRRDESDQHFDPDNPWATEEGVPGVLKPAAAPIHHDAGPGVIGIDR